MKIKLAAVVGLFTIFGTECVTNDIITVRNNTSTPIVVWLSGYRITDKVIVQPTSGAVGQVLISEEPAFICTQALETAVITLNVNIGNDVKQKTITRNYTDGCGFSNDRIQFLINQNSDKSITIDVLAVEKSLMLYQR